MTKKITLEDLLLADRRLVCQAGSEFIAQDVELRARREGYGGCPSRVAAHLRSWPATRLHRDGLFGAARAERSTKSS
jgi:hypothetical protein